MGIASLYLGRVADNPMREYTLDGAPLARFVLCCPADGGDGRPSFGEPPTEPDEVHIAVETSGELADLALRNLRRGDQVLVFGGLATSPPDPGRRGATDLYVRAQHIGLEVTTDGWHREPEAPAPVSTGSHPEFHW